VVIGGVSVTCAQAASALDVLGRTGGAAIRQVLTAAGSPLAACDYPAAAAPLKDEPFREIPFPPSAAGYGRGAAGRPAARQAFIAAIEKVLRRAETAEPARQFAAELAGARDAFSSDAGYAAAMAAAAVAVREKDHGARLRVQLAAAVHRALSACDSRRGEFSCAALSACGTGDCRLAEGPLAGLSMSAPALTGRVPRPANHAQAGAGFGTSAALAALEAAVPFDVAGDVNTVRVTGADHAVSADTVAGAAA
jgi:hypothetical protein